MEIRLAISFLYEDEKINAQTCRDRQSYSDEILNPIVYLSILFVKYLSEKYALICALTQHI